MSEILIHLDKIHPAELFGAEEEKLRLIKKYYPQIKIVLRGDLLKAIGNEDALSVFQEKMGSILYHYHRFNRLNERDIDSILSNADETSNREENDNNLIVNGVSGRQIKALTQNQLRMVKAVEKNDMIFAVGPAGSGKTYTAVAMAVKALKNKEVKRIILTRPAVEAGENLGFLPGDMKEKLDPYMQPLYDALKDMIPYPKLLAYLEEGVIEIAPLAFMRGRTLDHAFVILDEAQNVVKSQMKMFLTRMGKSAKFVITGDITQIDLPKKQMSGLLEASHLLKEIDGIAFIRLTGKDVVRHPLVVSILEAYDQIAPENA